MTMSQSLVLRQKQEQRLEQRLTQEQRALLQAHLFSLRMELVSVIHGEMYVPKGECPKCFRRLTPLEIIKGFNRDPNDFTTCCTGCRHRFEPRLVCFTDSGEIELPFYCDSQMLAQLHGKENIEPAQLLKRHPALYRAAIVHHGGIAQAFKRIGIEYAFEDITDWRNKVKPFLGHLPDTTIAECINTSVSAIRNMRKKLGLKRYRVKDALETAHSTQGRYSVIATGVYRKKRKEKRQG